MAQVDFSFCTPTNNTKWLKYPTSWLHQTMAVAAAEEEIENASKEEEIENTAKEGESENAEEEEKGWEKEPIVKKRRLVLKNLF